MDKIVQTWGKRLVEVREKYDFMQAELGRMVGKSETYMSRIERGVSGKKGVPAELARALRKVFTEEEVAYIKGKEAKTSTPGMVREPAPSYNMPDTPTASIPILSIKASAGGGNHIESIDAVEVVRRVEMDRGIFGVDAAQVRAIEVDGDSMVPTLLPGNLVFFIHDGRWDRDGLYIVAIGGVLMVKQIERDPITGRTWIRSANPGYQDYDYDPEVDQTAMQIIGRVVRVLR